MTLQDALQILESRKWCNLRVITANVQKGTGGKVLELPKCRIAHKQPAKQQSRATGATTKTANHNQHFTRNVELANSQRVITIHPILITHINNIELL